MERGCGRERGRLPFGQRATGSKIEALMSGLWRLQASVLDLFSPAVRAMLDGRSCCLFAQCRSLVRNWLTLGLEAISKWRVVGLRHDQSN